MLKLLIATHNQGKVREYAHILGGLPLRLLSLAEAGVREIVEESGQTYAENAALKAKAYARASGLLTLADDSGLEVDALGGEPGVRAARYAGEDVSDEERVRYLLSRLEGVPWERRTARFVCVIALATPECSLRLFDGACEGLIALTPCGDRGFGYDPVFYLPSLDKHMAELSLEDKTRASHRGAAGAKARVALERMLKERA